MYDFQKNHHFIPHTVKHPNSESRTEKPFMEVLRLLLAGEANMSSRSGDKNMLKHINPLRTRCLGKAGNKNNKHPLPTCILHAEH